MQGLLESERQRSEECEKKFTEAQETIEVMKSAENEIKVLKLQDSNCCCLFHYTFLACMFTVVCRYNIL